MINPNARLTSDRAAFLTNELYDSLPGIVVPRTDLGVLERDLTEKQILETKAWRIVLGHPDEVPAEFAEDPNLMKESYRWVKGQTKQDKNMGVYLDDNSEDAKLRAFCVDGLDGGSGLYGRGNLYDDYGRLVGYLASETPNAPVSDGEEVVRTYTEADVEPAKRELAELEKFVKPESVDSIKSLVGKL